MYMTVKNLSQRGFNLIEAAIVLGVVGLVIGGIWVAAASVQDRLKISDISKGVLVTASNIRRLLPASMHTGSDIWLQDGSHSSAISMRLFPNDWVKGAQVFAPTGEVTMLVADWGTGPLGIMQIHGFSTGQCIRIINGVVMADHSIGGAVSPSGHSFVYTRTQQEIKDACSGSETANRVDFHIPLTLQQ